MTAEQRRAYFRDLFPVDSVVHVLTHDNRIDLRSRDIKVQQERTAATPDSGRTTKFVSIGRVKSAATLRCKLAHTAPVQIDVGAAGGGVRELVFDVDLSDYDDVRRCCQQKTCCSRCWRLAVVAMEVLRVRLLEEFGWQRVAWVFSGRRGLHAWVLDEAACLLTTTRRAELLTYLTRTDTPVVQQHVLPLLRAEFAHYVDEQGLDVALDDDDIVLRHLYPRFDERVTTNTTHLIKAPFSPHHVTGKIATPLSVEEVRSFDIERDSLAIGTCTKEQVAKRCEILMSAFGWTH